jgi:tyrosinase
LDERKDVAGLNPTERQNFVDALLDLKRMPSKANPPPGFPLPQPTNRYDDFVMMHMLSFSRENPLSMIAHGSPTFLPWHRAYLRMLERELQNIKPEYKDVTIPYWDWTSAESNKAVWDEELMGGEGRESDGRVMNGKFAYDSGNWDLYIAPEVSPLYNRADLCRRFNYYIRDGVPSEIKLPTATHVTEALETDPYDSPQWNRDSQPSFRNILEGGYGAGQIHNIVHVWVGGLKIENTQTTYAGAMSSGGSPNDPCFWLHHSNLDRLWADWQLDDDRWNLDYKGYRPVNEGPAGLNVNDPMLPWLGDITPARVADFYRIDSKGYKYKKYFRDHIKDNDTLEIKEGRAISSPIILEPIFDNASFNLLKGSPDALIETLKKPVFPIK